MKTAKDCRECEGDGATVDQRGLRYECKACGGSGEQTQPKKEAA